MTWYDFEHTYLVYISPDEGVVDVIDHDTAQPVPDEIADLVAWAVGVGQRIGLEGAP